MEAEMHAIQQPLDLEDGIEVFLKNSYRRARLPGNPPELTSRANRPLLSSLQAAERVYGKQAVRMAWLRYLATDDEYVREARWPVRLFLKQMHRYIGQDGDGNGHTGSTHTHRHERSPRTAKAFERPAWLTDDRLKDCVTVWTAASRGARMEQLEKVLISVAAQLDGEDHARNRTDEDAYLELRFIAFVWGTMHAEPGREWANENWILSGDPPNWKRILEGQFNWVHGEPQRCVYWPSSASSQHRRTEWLDKVMRVVSETGAWLAFKRGHYFECVETIARCTMGYEDRLVQFCRWLSMAVEPMDHWEIRKTYRLHWRPSDEEQYVLDALNSPVEQMHEEAVADDLPVLESESRTVAGDRSEQPRSVLEKCAGGLGM